MTNPYQELALTRSMPTFKFHYVDCDVMNPTYRIGDWLIFVPVEDYLYEAVYIVDNGFGFPLPYRVDCFGDPRGHLRMYRDNKLYGTNDSVSREWFKENVYGMVIGSLRLPHHRERTYGRTA